MVGKHHPPRINKAAPQKPDRPLKSATDTLDHEEMPREPSCQRGLLLAKSFKNGQARPRNSREAWGYPSCSFNEAPTHHLIGQELPQCGPGQFWPLRSALQYQHVLRSVDDPPELFLGKGFIEVGASRGASSKHRLPLIPP